MVANQLLATWLPTILNHLLAILLPNQIEILALWMPTTLHPAIGFMVADQTEPTTGYMVANPIEPATPVPSGEDLVPEPAHQVEKAEPRPGR
jgi:hypothetical protein